MKIGIDIGGSHIGIGLIINGQILDKIEHDITNKDKEEIGEAIKNIIYSNIDLLLNRNNLNIYDIELIGIASPGTVRDGMIVKATNLGLTNYPICEIIEKKYQIENILKNDGKAAAQAEKEYGSMKDYNDFVYLCIGTGIGAGVMMGGKLLVPKRNTGFELGHMVVKKDGIECTCGRCGCFERYASIKVFKNKIIQKLNLDNNISGEELVYIIRNEKEKIEYIIDEYIDDLLVGIANIINIFEPEAICLGGSFVFFKDILLEKLKQKIKEKNILFNNENIPDILCAKYKNDAGIIGAVIK